MHALRQGREQLGQAARLEVRAGRVVGVADRHHAGTVGHCGEDRLGVDASGRQLDGHRPASRTLGHERIERIGGPWRDELVAGLEQHVRRRLEQLGGAVADRDLLGLDTVAAGQSAPQPGGKAVGVAVDPPAGRVDRGVHDLRVRKVGPLGTGEVEHRAPTRWRRRARGGGARAARGLSPPRRSPRTDGSSRAGPCGAEGGRGPARRGPARPGPEGLRGPLGHERRPRSHDDEAAMAITAWSRRSARALPAPDRGRRPAHQHPDVVEPPQDDEREQERDHDDDEG